MPSDTHPVLDAPCGVTLTSDGSASLVAEIHGRWSYDGALPDPEDLLQRLDGSTGPHRRRPATPRPVPTPPERRRGF
jgi:hypothetical protein